MLYGWHQLHQRANLAVGSRALRTNDQTCVGSGPPPQQFFDNRDGRVIRGLHTEQYLDGSGVILAKPTFEAAPAVGLGSLDRFEDGHAWPARRGASATPMQRKPPAGQP